MPDLSETLSLAIARHQAGNLRGAGELYAQVLREEPRHAQALYLSGMLAFQLGQLDRALALLRSALAVEAGNALYHCNLGAVYRAAGRWQEAAACYREALRLAPDYAEAHNNLGVVLMEHGQADEALVHLQDALRLQPGNALAHNNLGNVLKSRGRLEEAEASYRAALRLQPDLVLAHNNLGNVLKQLGRADEALASYRQALALRPDFAEAHNNLGSVHRLRGDLAEASACYQQALALRPDAPETYNNLGIAYMESGRPAEASAAFRAALRLKPSDAVAHSNLLFCLNYDPFLPPAELFAEHCRWAHVHARPMVPPRPHANVPDPERRLKVGYVSPDLRLHVTALLVEPVFKHHDPEKFEIFGYAQVPTPDAVTARLQALMHGWHFTTGLDDAQLAEQIRADGIDILVDLAGHTTNHRLQVFAHKPAPVQVTWLGYPNTTGLEAIDYRLTDAIADPPGEPRLHAEELVRLPAGICFYPPPADAPDVAPPPALTNGFVTFGAIHTLAKINSAVVDLWCNLLRAVPTARFLLFRQTLKGQTAEFFRKQFQDKGLGPDRVELRCEAPGGKVLNLYREIDVFLDPFPWGGHTTTYEALWMGVPVLTLFGNRHAGRWAASVLTQLGLPELIAQTPAEFVTRGQALAGDRETLVKLRFEMRDRMRTRLCDAMTFTRGLEEAYRGLWRSWCKGILTR